jgi:hypothetical protein
MLRITHCLDNRLTNGGKFFSLKHRPYTTPQIFYFSAPNTQFCQRLSNRQDLVRRNINCIRTRGLRSSVGIATGYKLNGRANYISVLHSFKTGSVASRASHLMATALVFPGGKAVWSIMLITFVHPVSI